MSLLYPKTAHHDEQVAFIRDAQVRLARVQQRLREHAASWLRGYARDPQAETWHRLEFVGCLIGQLAYECMDDKKKQFTTVQAQSALEADPVGGCMYDAVRLAIHQSWLKHGHVAAPAVVEWNDHYDRNVSDVLDVLGHAQAVLETYVHMENVVPEEEEKEPV